MLDGNWKEKVPTNARDKKVAGVDLGRYLHGTYILFF